MEFLDPTTDAPLSQNLSRPEPSCPSHRYSVPLLTLWVVFPGGKMVGTEVTFLPCTWRSPTPSWHQSMWFGLCAGKESLFGIRNQPVWDLDVWPWPICTLLDVTNRVTDSTRFSKHLLSISAPTNFACSVSAMKLSLLSRLELFVFQGKKIGFKYQWEAVMDALRRDGPGLGLRERGWEMACESGWQDLAADKKEKVNWEAR